MRKVVLNAFKPSNLIIDPTLFAGRKKLVGNLADSLQIEGSVPVIFGERGVGKSSIALQTMLIGLGNVELLSILKLQTHVLSETTTFEGFWIPCNEKMKGYEDVIKKIIRAINRRIENPNSVLTTRTTKLNLNILEEEITTTEQPQDGNHGGDVEEEFLSAVARCERLGIERFLFFLDEFDRIRSSEGVAGFIKNNSSEAIKFAIVGIAENISGLLADHSSLSRQLIPIQVKSMTVPELLEISEKVEKHLHDNGVRISFSEKAKEKLAHASGGFPWFVHVIGQDALIQAFDQRQTAISEDDIDFAIFRLAENRYANQFNDLYFKVVRDSEPRETYFRLLAKWSDDNIPLSEINRMARALRIANPSLLKKQLMTKTYGEAIYSPEGHRRGLVRFANKMFKRYVNLRPTIYQGVSKKVSDEWEKRN